jgi:hypothetical protein
VVAPSSSALQVPLADTRTALSRGNSAAHELHEVGAAGVHERLQDRRVLRRRLGTVVLDDSCTVTLPLSGRQR